MLLPPVRKYARPTLLQRVKRWVQACVPPAVYAYAHHLRQGCPRYYGRQQLDRMLEQYLNYDGGYFVELGANDGVAQSNTLYFEARRGWTGLLVEPAPNNYLRCRANRSDDVQVFCNACVPFDYTEPYVELIYADLMSIPLGLESDVADPRAHAQAAQPFLRPGEAGYRFGAVARPLNALLLEANAPAVMDLLSLDVEGAELAVLKGIDHQRFRFKYICVESRDEAAMTAYLAGAGYRLVKQLTHLDYLYADEAHAQFPLDRAA